MFYILGAKNFESNNIGAIFDSINQSKTKIFKKM